jgi:hypothetical protein
MSPDFCQRLQALLVVETGAHQRSGPCPFSVVTIRPVDRNNMTGSKSGLPGGQDMASHPSAALTACLPQFASSPQSGVCYSHLELAKTAGTDPARRRRVDSQFFNISAGVDIVRDWPT